jgi:predicted nuclease of predicted toxin-antitoxin system
MHLLANENLPRQAVRALREAGHDVQWIHEDSPGVDDQTVLARAQRENRILITFDKDFGELAFRSGLNIRCGVILFRLSAASPGVVAERTVAAIATRADWAGHFSVVEESRIRMTPLPQ